MFIGSLYNSIGLTGGIYGGDFITYISRIRDDKTQKNSINMWVVSDNLLKGAALNAVQIANVLIKKYIN